MCTEKGLSHKRKKKGKKKKRQNVQNVQQLMTDNQKKKSFGKVSTLEYINSI